MARGGNVLCEEAKEVVVEWIEEWTREDSDRVASGGAAGSGSGCHLQLETFTR